MISNSDEITKDPPEKEIKFILELINLNKIVDALTIGGFADLATLSLAAYFKKVFIDFFIKYLITKLENAISKT